MLRQRLITTPVHVSADASTIEGARHEYSLVGRGANGHGLYAARLWIKGASSGLAMPRTLVDVNPTWVTASHGPGIEPCSQSGNGLVDA